MEEKPIVQFAKRMELLPPYLFGMINKMKMEKRWRREDVIDLGMGNPVDPTPERVTDKLCEVAKDPKTHRYPVADGLKNLRKEIAATYLRDYQVVLDPDSEVICTIGSKEGISHLALALMGPGDTVLVPAPAFPIHIYASVIAGGNAIRIPLEGEGDFVDRVARVCEEVIPTPKVLILNYPHNPTAKLGDLEMFEKFVRLAKKHRFMIIQDFAYSKITFDGYRAPSFLEVPGARDVAVEFGSFSKSYNMAGWRLGYCVGNRDIIRGLAQIKGYYDYGIFSAIQVAGIMALRECEDDIAIQVKRYQDRRDIMCEGLERLGWEVEKPKAGMFLWVKLPEPFIRMGSMDFSLRLMEEANVAVAPGIGFGSEGEGYLRLALVENEHRIRQAIRQMKKSLAKMEKELENPVTNSPHLHRETEETAVNQDKIFL